jgi:Bacterial CdiA-CT RNAse A domain
MPLNPELHGASSGATLFMRKAVGIRETILTILNRLVLGVSILGLVSCQPAATPNSVPTTQSSYADSRAAQNSSRATSGPARDLRRDEAAGGHIIRKHIGQTEQQLRERLEREPNITGASTYTDLPVAEHVVGAAIAQSQGEIQSWLSRSGRHTNLVLDYDSPDPIGRTMNRGENQSRVCQHSVVVLKYAGPSRYYVLTSYPECR